MSLITSRTGEVVTRIVAPRVELYWNPMTNEGRVVFHMEKMTLMGDELLSTIPHGILIREATPILMREFPAELPDGQGGVMIVPVTAGLLMAGLKAVFEEIYEESQESQLPDVFSLMEQSLQQAQNEERK